MTAIAFDTLKYTKILEDAGVPRQQAEAWIAVEREIVTDTIAAAKEVSASREEVVTFKSELKEDLQKLVTKADLKRELEGYATKHDLEILKRDLTISMGLIVTVAVGLVSAIQKLL